MRAVLAPSSDTSGRWGDPIGSLRLDLELAPGATTEVVFVLGAAGNRDEALALVDRYKDPAAVIAGGVLEEHLRKLCARTPITPQRGACSATSSATATG